MNKITLIGPVYPYKGGISHYTGMLCEALRKKYDVDMISYSMQYPKFLYKKEQRDYEDDIFKADDTKYVINTANPFNWIKTALFIKNLKPDLVIIQWWHPYFAPCYRMLTRLIHKYTKILFICHNVFPHERFPMDKMLTKMTFKHSDYFVLHSKHDEADLLIINPKAIYRRTVIPTFSAFNKSALTPNAAREKLAICEGEKVLLFFGFVREYKGLKHLLIAMPMIQKKLRDVRLLVVGDFGSDKDTYMDLIDELAIKKSISVYDEYVPDSEVEVFFKAADIAVLPYESATQSGIVQISYGFGLPVVATNVGGLPDVVTDGVTGYLVEPFRPDLIADAVCDFFENDRREALSENIAAESYRYSWERMVEVIESFEDDKRAE